MHGPDPNLISCFASSQLLHLFRSRSLLALCLCFSPVPLPLPPLSPSSVLFQSHYVHRTTPLVVISTQVWCLLVAVRRAAHQCVTARALVRGLKSTSDRNAYTSFAWLIIRYEHGAIMLLQKQLRHCSHEAKTFTRVSYTLLKCEIFNLDEGHEFYSFFSKSSYIK